MSVLSKLMQARLLLQAAPLKKSGHNKFAGYHYFELGDFLPTVQQIFSDLGLCGLVSYTADIATLTITDLETDKGVSITSPMGSAALKGCHEVQNIGAVETYQRRYLWVTAMEIVEHDALDSVTGSPDAALKAEPKSAKSVPADELSKQDADTVAFLTAIAGNVRSMIVRKDVAGAYDEIESHNLEIELKTALWALLDSKERSAIKAEATLRKQPKVD